jgi:hypothetical protein
MQRRTHARTDALVWRWARGGATSIDDLGTPLAMTGYALCVYDGTGVLRRAAEALPGGTCAGRPCWRRDGDRGFAFRDAAGSRGGLRRLALRAGASREARIGARTIGEGASASVLPLATPVTVQLQRSDSPACWTATYAHPDRNDGHEFRSTAE